MKAIELIQADITSLEVDCIVNAANSSLLGGSGVDGAIHEAAGPELLEECKTLNGCEVGKVEITKGYNLPAKYVIHTVGPVWHGARKNEVNNLRNCYINSLRLAVKTGLESIAFPCISTGVYHFPKEIAAMVALEAVEAFLRNNKQIKKVIFCVFDDENYSVYKNSL
ncbi:MAG: O-acetyl-ADP-ribose deacetylase [Marinifilaceae bacterium]